MTISDFLKKLKATPEQIQFTETMDVVAANYNYTATQFSNGEVVNEAGTNEGSCKLFAFAQLESLTEEQTLACFGNYYRVDVLQNPEGTDHGNIRNFIQFGWAGIKFEKDALIKK